MFFRIRDVVPHGSVSLIAAPLRLSVVLGQAAAARLTPARLPLPSGAAAAQVWAVGSGAVGVATAVEGRIPEAWLPLVAATAAWTPVTPLWLRWTLQRPQLPPPPPRRGASAARKREDRAAAWWRWCSTGLHRWVSHPHTRVCPTCGRSSSCRMCASGWRASDSLCTATPSWSTRFRGQNCCR